MKTRSKRFDPRRGHAAVELGLVLPVLLMIVLGAADFARFAHAYIAVTNGARAGAGYGIMHPFSNSTQSTWEANVRATVLDEMRHVIDNSGFTDSDVVVTTSRTIETKTGTGTTAGLRRITVKVEFPFETIVPWPTLPNKVPLTRQIVMRVIR